MQDYFLNTNQQRELLYKILKCTAQCMHGVNDIKFLIEQNARIVLLDDARGFGGYKGKFDGIDHVMINLHHIRDEGFPWIASSIMLDDYVSTLIHEIKHCRQGVDPSYQEIQRHTPGQFIIDVLRIQEAPARYAEFEFYKDMSKTCDLLENIAPIEIQFCRYMAAFFEGCSVDDLPKVKDTAERYAHYHAFKWTQDQIVQGHMGGAAWKKIAKRDYYGKEPGVTKEMMPRGTTHAVSQLVDEAGILLPDKMLTKPLRPSSPIDNASKQVILELLPFLSKKDLVYSISFLLGDSKFSSPALFARKTYESVMESHATFSYEVRSNKWWSQLRKGDDFSNILGGIEMLKASQSI